MKYAFITQHKNAYPISLQCQVLGVSRNGYYQYRKSQENKPRDPVHQEMIEWVQDIAKSSDDTYGSRRMKKALNVLGYPVSRDKARKLMREANVQELNAEKTRVVYCKDSNRTEPCDCYSFDFLGYTFRPRSARDRVGNFFVSFSPAISPKASKTLRQKVRRDWRLVSRVFMSLSGLAHWLNPMIAGWIQYYGRFRRSALHSVLNHINHALEAWAMRKLKRLRGRKHRARAWLRAVARRSPNLFVHWPYQGWMTRAV